jgi:hypothetical protein
MVHDVPIPEIVQRPTDAIIEIYAKILYVVNDRNILIRMNKYPSPSVKLRVKTSVSQGLGAGSQNRILEQRIHEVHRRALVPGHPGSDDWHVDGAIVLGP